MHSLSLFDESLVQDSNERLLEFFLSSPLAPKRYPIPSNEVSGIFLMVLSPPLQKISFALGFLEAMYSKPLLQLPSVSSNATQQSTNDKAFKINLRS